MRSPEGCEVVRIGGIRRDMRHTVSLSQDIHRGIIMLVRVRAVAAVRVSCRRERVSMD